MTARKGRPGPGPGHEDEDLGFETVVLRAMVMMMLADGKVKAPEEELISRVFTQLHGTGPEEGFLAREVEAIRAVMGPGAGSLDAAPGGLSGETYLNQATEGWNEEARRELLKAACMVAVADRELVRDERVMLIRFGRALRLPAHQVRALHDEISHLED